jgi:hypothetical protein
MTVANKQSPWFKPETPPERSGLYKVRLARRGRSHWAWWDGQAWRTPANDAAVAMSRTSMGVVRPGWLLSWAGVLK